MNDRFKQGNPREALFRKIAEEFERLNWTETQIGNFLETIWGIDMSIYLTSQLQEVLEALEFDSHEDREKSVPTSLMIHFVSLCSKYEMKPEVAVMSMMQAFVQGTIKVSPNSNNTEECSNV